ncbi:MAG: flavin reductase family protein [Phycisphaera sp.]|nr:MAG: flavin reductase family protein [Phycisphaera sp.]
MNIDPNELEIAERYKLLIGTIGPRPIAVVSTISTEGKPNLAPFSFFAGVGSNPMTLLFCPANDGEGNEKDSLRNAKPESEGGTGQFAVCVATAEIIERVAVAAEPLPHGESEYELSGLTPIHCESILAPRVKESPVCFECETISVTRTNPGAPAGGNVVMGRVVRVHVEDSLLNERMHTDQAALDLVGRMGGLSYCYTRDRFDLRPGKQ